MTVKHSMPSFELSRVTLQFNFAYDVKQIIAVAKLKLKTSHVDLG